MGYSWDMTGLFHVILVLAIAPRPGKGCVLLASGAGTKINFEALASVFLPHLTSAMRLRQFQII